MTTAVNIDTITGVAVTVYLSQADIGLVLGRDRTIVNHWRVRFRDDPAPFPEPDIWNGIVKGTPGWLPERMPEIVEWCRSHRFDVPPLAAVMAALAARAPAAVDSPDDGA